MKEKLIKELIIDDEENLGCSAISLVSQPAIEIDFLKFGNAQNITFAKVSSEEKRIVSGPAMIPDKEIFRYNAETNEEFYVWFSKETVEKISQKFLIESRQSSVNIEHSTSTPVSDVTLVESWIVKDPDNDKSNAMGYSVPVGTWMVSMKINNDEVWNELVKTSKVRGFSIEGYFVEKFSVQKEKLIENEESRILSAEEVISELQSLIDENNVEALNNIRDYLTKVE